MNTSSSSITPGSTSTKIVVLGESGVGKSTFVATVCKKSGTYPESTVGAAVSMAWHEYRAGSVEQREELIELWDIGGAAAHRPASTVFLDGATGIILVHDLANSKSECNLGQWLALVNGDRRMNTTHTMRSLMADVEASSVPILIVGTRLDQAPGRANAPPLTGAPRINMDCRKELVPGCSQAMTLSRFFDAVIDRARTGLGGGTSGGGGASMGAGTAADPRRRRILM